MSTQAIEYREGVLDISGISLSQRALREMRDGERRFYGTNRKAEKSAARRAKNGEREPLSSFEELDASTREETISSGIPFVPGTPSTTRRRESLTATSETSSQPRLGGGIVYRGPLETRIADAAKIICGDPDVLKIIEEVRKDEQTIGRITIRTSEPYSKNPNTRPWDGDMIRLFQDLDKPLKG